MSEFELLLSVSNLNRKMVGVCVINVRHTGHQGHITVESVGDVYVKWITTAHGKSLVKQTKQQY